MSVKSGTLTLTLQSGKDTAIAAYIDWYTELVSGNTYTMYISMYGKCSTYGVSGGRTCSYSFWVNDGVLTSSSKNITSDMVYVSLYSTSFTVTANDDGSWDGWFGGSFSFESSGNGHYEVSGDATDLVVGTANYKVYYYTGYGSNELYATKSGYDNKSTCTVISDTLTRSNSTSSSNFTITGNKNGGDVDITVTATKTTTTKYTFKGWSTTSGATTATYSSGSTFTVTGNVKLYGVWSSSTSTSYSNNSIGDLTDPTRASTGGFYNITLIPNNGQESSIIEAGTFTSYTFKGWASSSTSTTALATTKTYTAATTVYAIWESSSQDKSTVTLPTPSRDVQTLATYTVTLDPNGGTVSPTSMTSSKTRSYVFNGWSTVSDNSSYIVSNTYTPTNKSAHSLYAIWTETESTSSISLPTPKYPSFKFLGWGINANSTSYVSMTYTPEQSITLYAIYKASYTGETYIYHNGAWHRVVPHLRHDDVYNGCINAT